MICPVCKKYRLAFHIVDDEVLGVDCINYPPCEISEEVKGILIRIYKIARKEREEVDKLQQSYNYEVQKLEDALAFELNKCYQEISYKIGEKKT